MALLDDYNNLKAEAESLRTQLATASGHSKQVTELTETNRVLLAEKSTLEDSVSKLTGELAASKTESQAAKDATKAAVDSKDAEWQQRAATEAAKIVAAAGGQPVENKPASAPAAKEQPKNLTGRDRFNAAFAEANPNLVTK